MSGRNIGHLSPIFFESDILTVAPALYRPESDRGLATIAQKWAFLFWKEPLTRQGMHVRGAAVSGI